MLTVFGFQVAFYILAGLVVVLSSVNIYRKRRRKQLLEHPSLEESNRLDRLQREVRDTERQPLAVVQPGAAASTPIASSILREQLPERAVSASVSADVDSRSGPADLISREGSIYKSSGSGATTWQDRSLFSPASQSGWRGSADIPKVDPNEVPSVGVDDYTFGSATPILASFLPESEQSRVRLTKELKQAGDYAPHARENLAATRFLFMFGSMMFGGACVLLAPRALEQPLLIGTLVLTALGWSTPALMVRAKATSRRTEVERGIPDLMDMLNMCVSQGLTVPESLARISRDLRPVYPALSQELAIVVDQTRVGTLNEAMQNFAERIELPQVDSFVSLMTQSERMGTSVSDALTGYSDNMRESLRQRADERANQSSFALLFPTTIFLMPAVFIFLMGPAVIELAKFTNAGGLNALDEGRQNLQNLNQQPLRGGGAVPGGGAAAP